MDTKFNVTGYIGQLMFIKCYTVDGQQESETVCNTFDLHVIWAVVVNNSEKCCSITNIPHEVLNQWKEGHLSTRTVLPTIPDLTTRGRAGDKIRAPQRWDSSTM